MIYKFVSKVLNGQSRNGNILSFIGCLVHKQGKFQRLWGNNIFPGIKVLWYNTKSIFDSCPISWHEGPKTLGIS